MAQVRVLIVDDRAMTRDLLAERLRAEPDMSVQAVQKADACLDELGGFEPDVVLMEVTVAGLSPFVAARSIVAARPGSGVLFMSREVREVWIEQALESGARGYICQHEPLVNLPLAIRKVAEGGYYFSPQLEARLQLKGRSVHLKDRRTLSSTLSPREREVLTYIAGGMASKEIARVMHLSSRTVETHTAHLMQKLKLRDRVALARFAIREGLATP